MKPPLIPIACFMLCFALSGCHLEVLSDVVEKAPCDEVASFELNTNSCNELPCTINITNTSRIGESSYLWTLDGTIISDEFQPEPLVFTEFGNHTLELQVTCTDGSQSNVAAESINIVDPSQPPVAEFTIENNNCFAPCTITLDNSASSNYETIEWQIDGVVASMIDNPSFSYHREQVEVPVTLTLTNGSLAPVSTQRTLNIQINRFSDFEVAGAGKAIFPLDDGYLIVGNEGVSGTPFVHRINKDGTTFSAAYPKILPAVVPELTVESAIQLQDGTFALIGSASDPLAPYFGKNRILYFRFDDTGAGVGMGQIEFLPETLSNPGVGSVFAKDLEELPSEEIVIVGEYTNDGNRKLFIQAIERDLELIGTAQVIDLADGSDFYTRALAIRDEQIYVGGFAETGSDFQGAVAGFSIDLALNFSSMTNSPGFIPSIRTVSDLIWLDGNHIALSGKDQNDDPVVGVSTSSFAGMGNLDWTNPVLDGGFINGLSLSADQTGLGVLGARNSHAAFSVVDPLSGAFLVEPVEYAFANSRLYAGQATVDFGWILTGGKGADNEEVIFVKTGEQCQAN